MAELSHVSMKFGDIDKIRTKHLYTREQAKEIQQIAAKAAEIAYKYNVELVPLPVKGGELVSGEPC